MRFDPVETAGCLGVPNDERHRSFAQALGDIYTLSNFTEILFNQDFPFFRFFLNSLIVAASDESARSRGGRSMPLG